jgi:hypothetical protein
MEFEDLSVFLIKLKTISNQAEVFVVVIDRMVVGLTNIHVIGAYHHHWCPQPIKQTATI